MTNHTIRAFVLIGPGEYTVWEVPVPSAAPGEAVVEVERVGVCGTDVEFFTGEWPTYSRVVPHTRCVSDTSGLARSPR